MLGSKVNVPMHLCNQGVVLPLPSSPQQEKISSDTTIVFRLGRKKRGLLLVGRQLCELDSGTGRTWHKVLLGQNHIAGLERNVHVGNLVPMPFVKNMTLQSLEH